MLAESAAAESPAGAVVSASGVGWTAAPEATRAAVRGDGNRELLSTSRAAGRRRRRVTVTAAILLSSRKPPSSGGWCCRARAAQNVDVRRTGSYQLPSGGGKGRGTVGGGGKTNKRSGMSVSPGDPLHHLSMTSTPSKRIPQAYRSRLNFWFLALTTSPLVVSPRSAGVTESGLGLQPTVIRNFNGRLRAGPGLPRDVYLQYLVHMSMYMRPTCNDICPAGSQEPGSRRKLSELKTSEEVQE